MGSVLVILIKCFQLTIKKSIVLNVDCGKVLGFASFSFPILMFKESFIPCAILDCCHYLSLLLLGIFMFVINLLI